MTKEDSIREIARICTDIDTKIKDLESLKSDIKHYKSLVRDQMAIYEFTPGDVRRASGLPLKWLEEDR